MQDSHFDFFRNNIIGINQTFPTPYGEKRMIYADWIASGRLYQPIEDKFMNEIYPFCGNTHTETSITGTIMTKLYLQAKSFIKQEVNASDDDFLLFEGSGMTAGINKLQRIMGLRLPERCIDFYEVNSNARKPVVFITHMEHHSNHTSWLETAAKVEVIKPTADGLVDIEHLKSLLKEYQDSCLKIASVTAASNVTGIKTPYHEIAQLMHDAGGYCFVDFACAGPYVAINMHPEKESEKLDAIFLSPHKFLGGPGTPGVLIFNKILYKNTAPDNAGGGTVTFTSPFGFHEYKSNIEDREDAGTPPFLQGIRTALCFKLKREMGVDAIHDKEKLLLDIIFDGLKNIPGLQILEEQVRNRVGAFSFHLSNLHYNLGVKLLNDHYGIQVRGGCACAGTYGHYLLNIDEKQSDEIRRRIQRGDTFSRPGWIRLSVHPTMTIEEAQFIVKAITHIANDYAALATEYEYVPQRNIFRHKTKHQSFADNFVQQIFSNTAAYV